MEHFYESVPGFFHFAEGYRRILAALPIDRPSQFVEIGSFCGKSLSFFAVEAINRHIPVTMHAVDSFVGWEEVPSGEDLRQGFLTNTAPVRETLGDRFQLWAMPSEEAASHFVNGSLDAVWIDADHSYSGCKADILAWFPKLKHGGIMGGDDFLMTGVSKAVVEVFGADYICGHGVSEQNPEVTGPWLWWMVRAE